MMIDEVLDLLHDVVDDSEDVGTGWACTKHCLYEDV